MLAEYGELYLQNTDMVGWLSIVGTNINYSVMQTPNNPNYYLKYNFEKDFDGLDKNSIILFEQIRTIDKQRLREYLGTLDRRFIHCADKALAISIGLVKKGLALSLYGTSGSSYTLETREVLRLLHREFVYVGDPVPELNEQEHVAFLMNIQKSILLSLEKRKLLTHSQRERCLVELEKQYSREQKSRRRA